MPDWIRAARALAEFSDVTSAGLDGRDPLYGVLDHAASAPSRRAIEGRWFACEPTGCSISMRTIYLYDLHRNPEF